MHKKLHFVVHLTLNTCYETILVILLLLSISFLVLQIRVIRLLYIVVAGRAGLKSVVGDTICNVFNL